MDFNQMGIPKIGAVIRGKSPATSMSYHEDGSHLYVASEDDSRLRVIDCQRGALDRPALKFERDGVRLVEATHHNQCLLYTSPKTARTQTPIQRHSIHYLSLHDNKILRHFGGHSDQITNLSMSPVDDHFLSSSRDRTVRLWDLATAGAVGEMNLPIKGGGAGVGGEYVLDPEGGVMASYDSTGLVFGITTPLADGVGNLIHLYDARNYGNGAFADYKVNQTSILAAIQQQSQQQQQSQNTQRQQRAIPSNTIATELSFARWTSMKFNTSGKKLLVTTDKGMALVLDGYDGSVTDVLLSDSSGNDGGNALTMMTKCPSEPMTACFTRDDRTVLCGNGDGTIGCWSLDAGGGASTLVQTLKGHVGRVGCMATNPKYAQIATACTNTAVWLW